MPGAWSVGAPVRPAMPAPARQLTPPPAASPALVTCPHCQATEGIIVRTSRGTVSSLRCAACGHTWRDARRLVRVLVAETSTA